MDCRVRVEEFSTCFSFSKPEESRFLASNSALKGSESQETFLDLRTKPEFCQGEISMIKLLIHKPDDLRSHCGELSYASNFSLTPLCQFLDGGTQPIPQIMERVRLRCRTVPALLNNIVKAREFRHI